jgi:phage anti-repressor protein
MTDYSVLIPFIKNTLDNEVQQTVNARDLHTNLEIGKEYRSWIRAQIKRLGFTENVDFVPVTLKGELAQGGSYVSTEYYLTLDAAKHVALASRTAKGREIRTYFIEAEKALREGKPSMLDRYPELKAIAEVVEGIAELRYQNECMTKQLIETQAQTIQALQAAQQANAKAELALEHSHTMTVEEFVMGNRLLHQFPPNQWRRYAVWLGKFCDAWGLPVLKVPVAGKAWTEENAYSIQAFSALLRHETKKPRQLAIVQKDTKEEDTNG